MLYASANKPKILLGIGIITIAIFAACSDDNSSGAFDREVGLRNGYPIKVNEEDSTFTLYIAVSGNKCILRESGISWEEDFYNYTQDYSFRINGDYLTLNDGLVLKGESNKSLYGTWYEPEGCQNTSDGTFQCESIKKTNWMKFTRDSMITYAGNASSSSVSEPVETPINLEDSYFMYDLYRCISKDRFCSFGHWHFTKDAKDLIGGKIRKQNIEIKSKSSNAVTFEVDDREFSVQVEHVQVDSLNNGNEHYVAYVQTNQDTCYFEHSSMPATKEVCTEENLDYFLGYEIEDEENPYVIFTKYVKDNTLEFENCVFVLTKKNKD